MEYFLFAVGLNIKIDEYILKYGISQPGCFDYVKFYDRFLKGTPWENVTGTVCHEIVMKRLSR
jgi:hypothetical protein